MTVSSLVPVSGQTFDRTVAIVGEVAITASEVALQTRLEAMANGADYIDSRELREAVLGRLIDQLLVANDIQLTGLPPLSDKDRLDALEQLRVQRFGELSFDEALDHYDVTSGEAVEFFAKQIEFTRFVDFRFRTGQTVTDEAIAEAYASIYGRVPDSDAPALADVRATLRQQLVATTVERQLDHHIRQLRADNRVVRLQPIDRGALTSLGDDR